MEQSLLKNLTVTQLVKKFPAFYETKRIITMFTRARHWSNPEPDKFSEHPRILFIMHFNITLPCKPRVPKGFLQFSFFFTKILYAFHIFLMSAKCHADLIILNCLISLIVKSKLSSS
jgi:hypothetical protein